MSAAAAVVRTLAAIRGRVFRFGRLGRALGETIAVLLILSPDFTLKIRVLETGGMTASYLIGSRYAEATEFSLSALMAAGLALFAMTLAVNFTASAFVARSRSGASSEA